MNSDIIIITDTGISLELSTGNSVEFDTLSQAVNYANENGMTAMLGKSNS